MINLVAISAFSGRLRVVPSQLYPLTQSNCRNGKHTTLPVANRAYDDDIGGTIFRDLCAKFILRFNFMVQSMKFYRWPCEQEGSLYYQPNQCIVVREIPENYQKYVLLDSLKMGNLMTHEQTRCQNRPKKITAKDQEGFKIPALDDSWWCYRGSSWCTCGGYIYTHHGVSKLFNATMLLYYFMYLIYYTLYIINNNRLQ